MNGLIIGNRTIPIVRDVVLTGRPPSSRPSWTTMLTYFTPVDDYEFGVIVGDYDNPINAQHGPITQGIYITGGTTSIDDGGELDAEIIEDSSYPYHAFSLRLHTNRNGVINYKEAATIGILPGFNGYTSYHDVGYIKLVALRYRYAGATSDNEKVWGYCVLKIQKEFRYRSDGTIYTENISTGGPIVIGLPNYNRADGTFFALEEVPIPDPSTDDPNEQDSDYPSKPSDPEGDYERDYDPIPVPNKPSDGVADAGFVTIYRMTFREFDEFASKCFADDVWSAIKLKFNNPTDFLVGAMLLPFIPNVGLSYYPKFGLKTLDTAYPRINNQFHDVDCGSVNITKYWGNCFDYEPYTKIQIWLPYIGYKDLPVDEFMGQTISVKYRCDCLTGDCIAFVYTGVVGQTGPQVERVIAQFYGNCGVRVPFGSQSFDAAVAAGITLIGAAAASGLVAAGSAAIGAESGAGVLMSAGQAAGGVATGAVGRASSVGVVQGMKPNVQHGGAAGSSGGYMSIQKPYLIRRIPRQSLPEGYMNLKGYPSNIGGKLADFTGLAIVDDIQLNNIPAMEDERKEIIDWLRGGVLI